MKNSKNATILLAGLLASIGGVANAAPIIKVTTDDLRVKYSYESQDNGISTTHNFEQSGNLLNAGAAALHQHFYSDATYDDDYSLDLEASAQTIASNSFELKAEADNYPMYTRGSYGQLDSIYNIAAEAILCWEFSVLNEDVEFWGKLFDEEVGGMNSIAMLTLEDITNGSSNLLINLLGGFNVGHNAVLTAGHTYSLNVKVGNYNSDDEDTFANFNFGNAEIVADVPEPATLGLMLIAAIGFLSNRRSRGMKPR